MMINSKCAALGLEASTIFMLLLLFCFGPNKINQCAIFQSDESESFIQLRFIIYAVRRCAVFYHHHNRLPSACVMLDNDEEE